MKLIQTARRGNLAHEHVDPLTFCYTNGRKIDSLPTIPRQQHPEQLVTPKSWYTISDDETEQLDGSVYENIMRFGPIQNEEDEELSDENISLPSSSNTTQDIISRALNGNQTQTTAESSFSSI